MGDLNDYAKRNSTFLKLNDGETVEVIFESFKIIPNKFDPEKESVQYTFLVDGTKKYWENGSSRTAKFFDGLLPGDIVTIKRTGEGQNTKYEFNIVLDHLDIQSKELKK